MARPERFELPTLCFEGRCSIQLSYGRAVQPLYHPCSYSDFLNSSNFNFRSIRSNWGFSRPNLKPQTDPRGPIMAKFDILFQLGVNTALISSSSCPIQKRSRSFGTPCFRRCVRRKRRKACAPALRLIEDR